MVAFFRCKHGDGTSPGDQVPGIGSGIAVGLNDSTAAAGFICTTQSPLQSPYKAKGLRVSDWALVGRTTRRICTPLEL